MSLTSFSLQRRVASDDVWRFNWQEWGGNTDLLKVFDLLLRTVAEEPSATMVEKLFIFTDMQFDEAVGGQWTTTYEQICQKYAAQQTKVPQIVFWNLRATAKSFPS